MAKKAKGDTPAVASADAKAAPPLAPAPMTGGFLDTILIAVAIATVALVAWLFQLDVNRVFDVPKALALKVGGAGLMAVFIARSVLGLMSGGAPWSSIRMFAAPVFTLLCLVGVSTVLSLDPWMSLYGVYERQFGFQGLLACVGLFAVTATSLRTRRGAVFAFGVLAVVGGVVGAYAYLQSIGMDPYGFFKKPNTKVYSTLGNATFAGNALALIFPMSLTLSTVAVAKALSPSNWRESDGHPMKVVVTIAAAALVVVGLMIGPGYYAVADAGSTADVRQSLFKLGVGLALVVIAALALVGNHGPDWGRLEGAAGRRWADSALAGAISAVTLGILVGLWTTRTRGAWVGTAVAMALGAVLLPLIFVDRPKLMKQMFVAGISALVLGVGGVAAVVHFVPEHVFSRTIRSIPAAFNPEETVYGQGQGTRPYLWKESPRVLVNNQATLDRKAMDRADWREHVEGEPRGSTIASGTSATLKNLLVWPFGIGIETYRYAFMSHKSKKLEALDPMTNHDNPHNNYLYTLASYGILGLLAYLWLLWRLLSTSFLAFLGVPLKVVKRDSKGELVAGAVKVWRLTRGEGGDSLELEASDASALAAAIQRTLPEHEVVVEGKRVIVKRAGEDPTVTLEQMTTVWLRTEPDLARRVLAFGVVTSFFSYSVYSIAGFDSVACSVFLYFFLGAVAVFLSPAEEGAPTPPLLKVAAEKWKRPLGLLGAAAVVLLLVSLHTLWAAKQVYAAERAFVGGEGGRSFEDRLEGIERAIQINPHESFYHQSLGSSYMDASRQYREAASRAQQQGGGPGQAEAYLRKAQEYFEKSEKSLYSALDHCWAPENIFISLFQLYYSWQKLPEAEAALERALMHSPHLGPVRANLAVLKLERGAYAEAMADCQWVLEVEQNNAMALRTCGRASQKLHKLAEAKDYLERAKAQNPRDASVLAYLKELEAPKTTTAASVP
ncbi:MAG: O-antigen ligase family protein [Myxococcota bacterium]